MDLIRLLRSLEEFLYELMSWLVFYPRTLVRILRNPVAVARYTSLQLKQDEEQQFTEMVSPVLMLILSVVLAHGLELVMKEHVDADAQSLEGMLFSTEQGLLVTRSVIYAVFALFPALLVMRRQRMPLDRDSLREPFYVQAYLAAPFAVLTSMASVLTRAPDEILTRVGIAVLLGAALWYLAAQAAVFRDRLNVGRWLALCLALGSILGACLILFALLLILVH
jgi:hypothetical protein